MKVWALKSICVFVLLYSMGFFAMNFFSKYETIESGEAYGFSIGMSKAEVFETAKQKYKRKKIYRVDVDVVYEHDRSRISRSHVELIFSKKQYEEIKDREIWEFHFKKNFRDKLRFYFEDDLLVSMYRHKELINLFSRGILVMSLFFNHHEEIESGEAYGFSIGMSKVEVFETAKQQYKRKKIYMVDLIDEHGEKSTGHVELVFSEQQYAEIKYRDTWSFYFKKNFRNMIRLYFEDDRLVEIYRSKKLINLS